MEAGTRIVEQAGMNWAAVRAILEERGNKQ
jgi:hypothetical protein